jgi:hypothetical protein
MLGRVQQKPFLELIEVLEFQSQHFFIWEWMELTVKEILISECLITEGEVAEIVYPVCLSSYPHVRTHTDSNRSSKELGF